MFIIVTFCPVLEIQLALSRALFLALFYEFSMNSSQDKLFLKKESELKYE